MTSSTVRNNIFAKDPDAVLDYHLDWSGWLPAGDAVSNSSWFVTDSNLSNDLTANSALKIDRQTLSNNISTVWLSGGMANTTYYLVNRITTVEGRTNDRHIQILMKQG